MEKIINCLNNYGKGIIVCILLNVLFVSDIYSQILEPTAGTVWVHGDTENIYWNTSGLSENIRIDYSLDGGNSWGLIISRTNNDGVYSFNVPQISTSEAQIRIINLIAGGTIIYSDLFTIAPPIAITIDSPIALDDWEVGTNKTISWSVAGGTIDNVNLEYFNGTTWNAISGAQNIVNSGSFLWTVADDPSVTAKIRVSDAVSTAINGESAEFVISPVRTITITSPLADYVWQVGDIQNIEWTSTGTMDSVIIEYYDGSALISVEAAENNGSFSWILPNTPTETAYIKISDKSDPSVFAESDQFTITLERTIAVLTPLLDEQLYVGDIDTITWSSTGVINLVDISYLSSDGLTWINLVQNTPNDGEFEWTIPDNVADSVLISITDSDYSQIADSSDKFIINAPTFIVQNPELNDSIRRGIIDTVKWNTLGVVSNVNLDYFDGTSWTAIDTAQGITNSGEYIWQYPEILTDQAVVRITDASNTSNFAESDTFNIVLPEIIFSLPVANAQWHAGSIQTISWNTIGKVNTVSLSYFDGSIWVDIAGAQSIVNEGTYQWTLPLDTIATSYIKIVDTADPLVVSQSNEFSIVEVDFAFVMPSGGQKWLAGTTHEISWSTNGPADSVKLDYFDGAVWLPINAGNKIENTGSYFWTIPNSVTNTALIKVVHAEYSMFADTSNVFEIIQTILAGDTTYIMPLGNSLTYDDRSNSHAPPDLRTEEEKVAYRHELWNLLRTDNYSFDFVGSLVNGGAIIPDPDHEGWPGITAATTALNVYNQLEANTPDVILLHIGTNDLTADPSDVEDILNEIDRFETDYNKEIWVLVAQIINRTGTVDPSKVPLTTLFNDNLEIMVNTRINDTVNPDKLILCDMENGAGINYIIDREEPFINGDMYDYLHPNIKGYGKMAQLWFDNLQLLLPPGTPTAPQIVSAEITTATFETQYVYDVNASGIGAPSYSLDASSEIPLDAINANTGVINWTPSAVGPYDVTVVASNSAGTDVQSFTINVTSGPPVVLIQPRSQGGIVGETVEFMVSAESAQGLLPLSYQWRENGTDILGAVDSVYTTNNLLIGDNGKIITCYIDNTEATVETDTAYLYVTSTSTRVTGGEVVKYDFLEGKGNKIYDVSDYGTELNLTIPDTNKINWLSKGIEISSATLLSSNGPATKIYSSLTQTNEVSIETWIDPANLTQTGPARLLTVSADPSNRNFTLGQSESQVSVRLRTTTSYPNGIPDLTTPVNALNDQLTHVVYTRDRDGNAKIYLDGILIDSLLVEGDFSSWNESYNLGIGNEFNVTDLERAWLGKIFHISIFNRALSKSELLNNYQQGINQNTVPHIVSQPVTQVAPYSPYIYNVVATGIPAPTFQLNEYPAGMSIDTNTGRITWSPTQIGSYPVEVQATNSEGNSIQNFSITVDNSMIAYWKLDEPVQTRVFNDTIGPNNGISASTTLSPIPIIGKVDTAMYFDGTKEIYVPHNSIFDWSHGSSFSVETWVKVDPTSNETEVYVGRYKALTRVTWWLGHDGNLPSFYLRDSKNNGKSVSSPAGETINDGIWHHIVGLYDYTSKELRLYVDGQLKNTAYNDYLGNFTETTNVTFGHLDNTTRYKLHGALDEIAIYNRTISAGEIADHFQKGNAGLGYNEVEQSAKLAVNVILEGAYDAVGDTMRTDINQYIPLTSPYSQDPITVTSIPTNAVDWVLVELRETFDGVAVISKSMFLNKDGNIVDIDGITTDFEIDVDPNNYYIVIRHRNHLDIISANAVPLSSFVTTYDFTIAQTQAYTTGPIVQTEVDTGIWAMFGGDADVDGSVLVSDKVQWRTDFLIPVPDGYHLTDLDLDGKVLVSDKVFWRMLFLLPAPDSQVP
ncbi:MAG: putative Ig domain-containing protein [Melioribacteraceae bacterium]|nr:putative Ig domain-containing protein [Melioribacteraceae bacterium]